MAIADTDLSYGNQARECEVRFEADIVLRGRGWRIWVRPKTGPPLWRGPKGQVLEERQALALEGFRQAEPEPLPQRRPA